jgi:hypothetical protein
LKVTDGHRGVKKILLHHLFYAKSPLIHAVHLFVQRQGGSVEKLSKVFLESLKALKHCIKALTLKHEYFSALVF